MKFDRDRLESYRLRELIQQDEVSSAVPSPLGHTLCDFRFPPEVGMVWARKLVLKQGIEVVIESVVSFRNLQMVFEQLSADPWVVANILFQGRHYNNLIDRNEKIDFKNQLCWTRYPEERYISCFEPEVETLACHISLHPDLLGRDGQGRGAIHGILSEFFFQDRQGRWITPIRASELYNIIRSISQFRLERTWDWIKLESLALNLAHTILEPTLYGLRAEEKERPLTREERDKLNMARQILESHYSQPHSLGELSRGIGLNEYKLKKGFKNLFGATVFDYLRQIRLENGAALLKRGEMNIGETAEAVGYSNSGAFATAFRRQFGISPLEYRKRYY